MSVQKALLIELFAIVVALYGGFTVLSTDLSGYPSFLHAGFYLGLIGVVYGIVGSNILNALRSDT